LAPGGLFFGLKKSNNRNREISLTTTNITQSSCTFLIVHLTQIQLSQPKIIIELFIRNLDHKELYNLYYVKLEEVIKRNKRNAYWLGQLNLCQADNQECVTPLCNIAHHIAQIDTSNPRVFKTNS